MRTIHETITVKDAPPADVELETGDLDSCQYLC